MKNLLCSLLLTLSSAGILAQTNSPDWENPEVFAINKEATRATSIPYSDAKSALINKYSNSSYFESLDGIWKFMWVAKPADIPQNFYKEDYSVKQWVGMPVPGNWEFNGFGIPMYVNTGFGFPKNPPFIDKEDAPVGAYRRDFNVPSNWDGRRVFLHFEGGTNAMYVWVNGEKVGYTENAKSPAEFDITSYIRKGQNTLACEVHKFSDASYLEDQDMWRLGGINRSVYLYSTAQTRILDFFAHPDLDANYKNGLFNVDVKLKNYGSSDQTQNLEVKLLDNARLNVLEIKEKVNISARGEKEVALQGQVKNILKWTAETPNLYSMLVTLKNEKGDVIEVTSHRIGFRKIELKDGQVLINGQKVYFKGVNLHEFNTKTGQVVDSLTMLRNIQLMKELNVNAVRTSHYPQSPLWYKLCDEYGIYLVDEANLESHGLGYGLDNVSNFPEWREAHMDRIIRLVERDKNHPSVIFWSLGNEASNGKAFHDMYDWAKARDNSRPVQYEQAGRGRNTDIICPMYPSWSGMQRDAKEDLGKPYIMCEYAHAMGNSMGNFQEYWDLMRSSKNMQGGFIWEWYNHGFKTKDEQGREYWAYGGDLKGYNKMNDGNFCIDGIISPDQDYLPHTYIVKKVYQNILFKAKDLDRGVITVINDFKFTDLNKSNYSYKWVLLKNGAKAGEGAFDVEVLANSQKDVQLKLPKLDKKEGVEYYLHVFAYLKESTQFIPVGFEVAKEEFAFGSNDYFSTKNKDEVSLNVETKDKSITVKAGTLVYEFSTEGGKSLLNITNDGKRVFDELPRPNFWRAPTDNEFGESVHFNLRLWDVAGHTLTYTYKGRENKSGTETFVYLVQSKGIKAQVELRYTVNKNGTLTIDSKYQALANDLPELMRFGMVMVLPKEYSAFEWYGRGPRENYVDRKTDTFMGIYEDEVSKLSHPYIRPQETGNRTDVRWCILKSKDGQEIKITGSQPLSVSASNNKTEDLDPGMTKKQQHASDVLPRKEVVLNVDLFQRGVGGLNSWGAAPLDEYRFSDKEYQYSYTIEIIK